MGACVAVSYVDLGRWFSVTAVEEHSRLLASVLHAASIILEVVVDARTRNYSWRNCAAVITLIALTALVEFFRA